MVPPDLFTANDQLSRERLPPTAVKARCPLGGMLGDGAVIANDFGGMQVSEFSGAGRGATPLGLVATRYNSAPGPGPVKASGMSSSRCQLPAEGKGRGETGDEHRATPKLKSAGTLVPPVRGSTGTRSCRGPSLRAYPMVGAPALLQTTTSVAEVAGMTEAF